MPAGDPPNGIPDAHARAWSRELNRVVQERAPIYSGVASDFQNYHGIDATQESAEAIAMEEDRTREILQAQYPEVRSAAYDSLILDRMQAGNAPEISDHIDNVRVAAEAVLVLKNRYGDEISYAAWCASMNSPIERTVAVTQVPTRIIITEWTGVPFQARPTSNGCYFKTDVRLTDGQLESSTPRTNMEAALRTHERIVQLYIDLDCPICKGPMKKRAGKFGHFFGCVAYPKCKGLRSYPDGKAKGKQSTPTALSATGDDLDDRLDDLDIE